MIYVMSGEVELTTVIAVTYPSGSICTCGGKKALDTSGYALFPVKAGTYTVECHTSDNSKSKSTSVTVAESDKGKSIAVTLSYELYIFQSGSGFVNGFSKSGSGTVTMDVFSQASGSLPKTTIIPDIDLSPYSQVIVDGKGINHPNYGHLTYLQVKSGDTVLAEVLIDEGRRNRSIDIRAINQVATLYLTGNTSGWEIYNLLLK